LIRKAVGTVVLDVDQIGERMVAVGVEASPESVAAARYAVHTASDRNLDVVLVHAYELPSVSVPLEPEILDMYQEAAHNVVRDITAQLVVPGHMSVASYVREGFPDALLLRVAERVPFLVVGQDHLTWGERLLFGQVAAQVAQKSACPVVVVPGNWRAPSTGPGHPVVVALEGDTSAAAALRIAFEQADLLRTGLLALHASPSGSQEAEIASQAANLTEMLAGWKQDYPGVTVDRLVVLGDEDANLVQWSQSAAVLVVERPERHWWKPWAHSVIGAVLKRTQCPLIVTPRQRAADQ